MVAKNIEIDFCKSYDSRSQNRLFVRQEEGGDFEWFAYKMNLILNLSECPSIRESALHFYFPAAIWDLGGFGYVILV